MQLARTLVVVALLLGAALLISFAPASARADDEALQKRIDALEAEIGELQKENAALEARLTARREEVPDEGEGEEMAMQVHYLEVVTPNVDEACAAYERLHGVAFGDPAPELGNARTATLADGSVLGIRAPMRDTEDPVVRPYWLVDDIAAAVESAEAAGAEVAVPPMDIRGRGSCAIYIQGGVQHGLWQR